MSDEDRCYWPYCKEVSTVIYACIEQIKFPLCDVHLEEMINLTPEEKYRKVVSSKRMGKVEKLGEADPVE
jgi:hypothetical protein